MKKITAILFGTLIISSLFSACGHDIPLNEDDIPPTEFIQTEPVTAPPTEPATQEATATVDMADVIENTYLCGTRLSNGLTWGMLEGDFSYSLEYAVHSNDLGSKKSQDQCSTDLYYKGQYVGMIMFSNVPDKYSISSDTPIKNIYIIGHKCEVSDVSPISVNGVELGDSREKAVEIFGEPDKYNSYRDNNDSSKFLKISYKDNKVSAVTISP